MGLGTTLKIAFDAKKVQRGLAGIASKMGAIGKKFATFGLAAVTTGFAAITAGLVAFTVSSSNAATSIESLTTQFTTLLGSTTAAQERMEEITKFAAETPFEIAELAKTSKLLQTLGGDLLATGDGLRLVGDAAAMSGQPLGEVGLSIGRIFNAITSGTSAGEAVGRLQELGLITGKVKLSFEALAASQKKGEAKTLSSAEALKLLREVMSQTAGGMDALSRTTEGKLSNMQDNISQLKVAFGTGFNDGLRIALDAVNSFLPNLQEKFTRVGSLIGAAISDSVNGNFDKIKAAGELIGNILAAAAVAAYQSGTANMWKSSVKWLEDVNPIRRGLEKVGIDAKRGSQTESSSFSELLDAQLLIRGVKQKLEEVKSGTQGLVPGSNGQFKYAPAGDNSSPFTDSSGNRIVQVLSEIKLELRDSTTF